MHACLSSVQSGRKNYVLRMQGRQALTQKGSQRYGADRRPWKEMHNNKRTDENNKIKPIARLLCALRRFLFTWDNGQPPRMKYYLVVIWLCFFGGFPPHAGRGWKDDCVPESLCFASLVFFFFPILGIVLVKSPLRYHLHTSSSGVDPSGCGV